jgi:multiple sugar transport system ATP-binding protein
MSGTNDRPDDNETDVERTSGDGPNVEERSGDGPNVEERSGGGPNVEGAAGERIRLDAVTKRYDDLIAVEEFSLEIEPGELLVLLGPSGCGKTTTLRMIAGLETVTSGTIAIGEQDVTQTLPQNRDVSMVFQSYALYPHKTVRGNLRFPLGKTDLTAAKKTGKVEEVAALLEISDILEKNPDQLSGGQKQRVAVGRTIIREPRVFLLDEPLSNLDAELRVQTRAELHSLQGRLGTTTVYVTHDQEEALSIADRVVIMNDGRIEQVGTPEEVYTAPKNAFVAGFLGDPAINFLEVENGHLLGGDVPLDRLGIDVPRGTARIGVRPEDAFVDPELATEGALTEPIAFTVDVVEPLGHTYEASLERNGRRFLVQSPAFDAAPGETVDVRFDADGLLAFDAEGGRL